jgi:3-dehydroquinate dehydratase
MRSDIIGWEDEEWFRQHAYPKQFQTEKVSISNNASRETFSNSSFISSVSNDRLATGHTLYYLNQSVILRKIKYREG